MVAKECRVEGCGGVHYAKGLCRPHYEQQQRGTPLTLGRGQYKDETAVCAADDCDNVFHQRARGPRRLYCSRTCSDRVAQRDRRVAGWVPAHKREDQPRCKVPGCPSARFSLGMCQMHYSRFKQHGDPGEVEPRRARNGEGEWRVNDDGYVTRNRDGRRELQHRVVMEEILGRALYGDETVHHKNGVRSDNRPSNLELWSSWQPAGQRVEDKIAWARELLARYEAA